MKYNQSFNKDKCLYPRLKAFLKAIPEDLVFGPLHPRPISHPGAIYNTSLETLLDDLVTHFHLMEEINQYRTKEARGEIRFKLLKNTKDLIADISSFYDNAFSVLLSITKPGESKQKFSYKILSDLNSTEAASLFQSSCQGIKVWQEINNCIKHGSQKLRIANLTDSEIIIEGYYLEGVSKNGALGPDEILVENYLKGAPFLSFERTAIMIFFSFYYLSDKLLLSVKKHLKLYHGYLLEIPNDINEHRNNIINVWERFLLSKQFYFPKEYRLRYPRVKRSGNIYTLSFPHNKQLFFPVKPLISVHALGDGYTTKFNIPGDP